MPSSALEGRERVSRDVRVMREMRDFFIRFLFFKFLSNNGETAEGEVFLDQIGDEDSDQQGINDESSPEGKHVAGILHPYKKDDRKYDILTHLSDGIGNGVIALSDKVG
jgi:hypothetical protein